ncbi:MAG: hypothetical protein AAGF94_14620 [Pseudomonadota bacterium]
MPQLWALVALVLVLGPGAASAQSSLEAERDRVFEAMFQDPTNLDLMLEYARLSVELRDYEQVVSTLERVVDQEPNIVEARLELAIAYYALGAYEIAIYHFDIVRAVPNAPPEVVAEITQFTERAEDRVAPQSIEGFIEAGPAYGFVDGGAGIETGLGLTWRVSLPGATAHSWITDLRAQNLYFPDDDNETVTYFLLRTGPEFSLDGETYGAKLRPYLAVRSSVDFDLEDRSTAGAGLQYSNVFSPSWSGFAVVEGGALRRRDLGEDVDGSFVSGQLGASYFASRTTLLRLSFRGRQDSTDDDRTDQTTWGVRADLRHAFLSPFGNRSQQWLFSAYGLVNWQRFPSLTPVREDRIYGIGASLRANMRRDFYVEARADLLERDTDVVGAATKRQVVSLVLGKEF